MIRTIFVTSCLFCAYVLLGQKYPYKSDEYFGLCDKDGNIVLNSRWDKLALFYDDLALAKKNESWFFIDTLGDVKIGPLKYNNVYPFENGLAYVEGDNYSGYINIDGNECLRSSGSYLKVSDSVFFSNNEGGNKFYHLNGEKWSLDKYGHIQSCYNELCQSYFNDNFYIISNTGDVLLKKL